MIDRIMTEKIKAEILNNGMDLIGFAPVERWKNAPFLLSPQAVMEGSKTVVVAGIHITDTWTEMGGEPNPQTLGPGGFMDHNSLLDRIAYKAVRLLNDYGYKAIGVASSNIWRYRKFEGVESWFAPDLSHIHAATAAGLTQIGWSGLAISPEFGPRVRYISIVTDAELEPTPMYDGPDLCDLCMECVKACPSYALKKDFDGKPHEIEIAGKKFRYANKNIWRCAWAEHFNLNLNSKTLNNDHVSENDILQELFQKGSHGHERGVCQKVCVPPHLRTEEPSFGRAGKKIGMKRINRRYPDIIPTLKKMRDDIISETIRIGAEIVSVAPLKVETMVGKNVLLQAPGMITVIGFAFQIPAEAKHSNSFNSYSCEAYKYAIYQKAHHIALKLARFVEDYGYHSVAYTGEVPIADQDLKKTLEEIEYGYDCGDQVAYKAFELAEMAGVGVISDMFKTAEFGENVIVGAVVTDAPLDPTPVGEYLSASFQKASKSPNDLKNDLAYMAKNNLVSLFGVASANIFDHIVEDLKGNIDESILGETVIDKDAHLHGKWLSKIINDDVKIRTPNDYMAQAKSVIVLGMHYPEELIENSGLDKTKQIGTYAYYDYQTAYELRFAALELGTYLNKLGFKTFITENMLGIGSKVDTPRQHLPDARCNAIEAVAAGLGEIGRNGSLLTNEFGTHQRQIIIITDAELPSDNLYDGARICTDCGNCEIKCPVNAYEKHFFKIRVGKKEITYPSISRHRCDWAKRYSLHKEEGPALIGNKTHVEPPHEGKLSIAEVAEACERKDEVMKKRTVILEPCLRFCMAGKYNTKSSNDLKAGTW